MSRPNPTPKQNFLQTALIMIVVYLGVTMYFKSTQPQQNQTPKGPALVTRADYLKQLQLDDQQGKEATATQLLGDYNRVIDQDADKKLITKAEAETEKIQGATIVANAYLKGGILRDNLNGIRTGYQTLQKYFRSDSDSPGWKAPVSVWSTPTTTEQISADALRLKIIDTLSTRNQSARVWNVIPGGYQLIDFLVRATGSLPYFSYAFAAFLLALVVRGAVFPLAQKQLMFSRQMSQLTPRLAEIKKQYANDTQEQSRRTMELYKTYGINPAAGCLPALVQMPLFFTVYQCMLLYQFQFSHGYFLWISPGVSAATHGFVGHDLGQQDYILIALYGISMTISTLLTPVTDPTQYKQQRLMGVGMSIMITVFMFIGVVPVVSGFVLYWTFTNILATLQSYRAYRLPLPPLVKVVTPMGGVIPSKGPKGIWMKLMEETQRMAEDQGKNKGDSNLLEPPNNGKSNKNGSNDKPVNGKSNGKPTDGGSKLNKSSDPKDGKTSDEDDEGGSKKPKYKPKKRG